MVYYTDTSNNIDIKPILIFESFKKSDYDIAADIFNINA